MNAVQRQRTDSSRTGFLCHLAFWFGPLFATPVFITITNQQDVVLSAGAVAAFLAPACLVLSAIGWKLAAWGGPRVEWWTNRVLLAAAFVLALQGNVVHDLFYYGAFNGEQVDFRSDPVVFEVEKWAYLLAWPLILLLLSRVRRLSAWLPALPVVSFSLLLIPAWLNAAPVAAMEDQDSEIDPSAFAFSSTRNLVHLLPDGFQSDVVRQVLQENPELAQKFVGFTLYTDHLGLYQGTAPALYTLLTGRPFKLEEGYSESAVNEDIRLHSYPARLAQAGFQVDYVAISPWICIDQANTCYSRPFNDMKARGLFRHHSEDKTYSVRLIADLSLFRLSPKWLKEKIYDEGNWFFADTTLDGSSPFPDPVLREWAENLTVSEDGPVYKWHHFIGTHIPAHWDRECRRQRGLEHTREAYEEQAYCVLSGIGAFLDRLREAGIYDRTAMVISGDHGHNIVPDDMTSEPLNQGLYRGMIGSGRPALLVKELQRQGPLHFSHAPTSLVDVAPTALALAGLEADSPPVMALDPGEPRERYFTPYSIPDLYGGDPIPYIRYRVGHPVTNGRGWTVADMRTFQTPPTEYVPVNDQTARGFMLGAILDRSRPDKDSAWIKSERLSFVISIPDPHAVDAIQATVHLPEWIPTQKLRLRMNDGEFGEAVEIRTQAKPFWQDVYLEFDPHQVAPGRNFVTIEFEQAYSSPEVENWSATALLNSIRVSKTPAEPDLEEMDEEPVEPAGEAPRPQTS
jgi:hypothetical protein